jgi:hypothetical protein
MKTKSHFTGIGILAIIVLVSMIFITNPLFSQDSAKKPHQQKQIKVVVKTDNKGQKHSLDTTFTINGHADAAGLKKVMKEYAIDLEGLEDDMGDMIVQIDDMDSPDSARLDSLCKMVKKIRITGNDGRGKARSFNYMYNFDEPGIPDIPPPPPPPSTGDFDQFGGYSGFESFSRSFEEQGSTLSDIIGDIPMERVTSYSIKETKHGKKIVIELSNDPMIERRDKVIIIREPHQRNSFGHPHNPSMKKKVIIRSGGDDEKEEGPKM